MELVGFRLFSASLQTEQFSIVHFITTRLSSTYTVICVTIYTVFVSFLPFSMDIAIVVIKVCKLPISHYVDKSTLYNLFKCSKWYLIISIL